MKYQGLNVSLHKYRASFQEYIVSMLFKQARGRLLTYTYELCLCFPDEYLTAFSAFPSSQVCGWVHGGGIVEDFGLYSCVKENLWLVVGSWYLWVSLFSLLAKQFSIDKKGWFYILSLRSYFSTVSPILGNVPVPQISLMEGDGI